MDYMQTLIDDMKSLETKAISKLEKLDTNQREMADRLLQIEQRGSVGHLDTLRAPASQSPGALVAKAFTENAESFFKGRTLSLHVKSVTSAQVGSVTSQGPSAEPSPIKTKLVSAIPMRSMQGIASLHYSRITDGGLVAGVQAGEGAAKTQAQPVFAPVTQNAITIAGWCEMSEQALKTQGELQKVIDTHLSNSVMLGLDAVLVDGTAEASWPFSGLETLAAGYVSATYTSLHDAIVEASAHMRLAGYEPDIVCINPMSFLGIALAKDTTGQYLAGSYMNELPAVLHGMRVTFSSGVAVGKALVLDSRFVEVLVSDELTVTFAYVDDGFIRNRVTARGEVSVIPVVRDLSALSLVAPKP